MPPLEAAMALSQCDPDAIVVARFHKQFWSQGKLKLTRQRSTMCLFHFGCFVLARANMHLWHKRWKEGRLPRSTMIDTWHQKQGRPEQSDVEMVLPKHGCRHICVVCGRAPARRAPRREDIYGSHVVLPESRLEEDNGQAPQTL